MNENREFKSDVFSMLMEDKANALEVYNALNGSSYDDPEQIELVNLQKGVSLSVRNDAAFIVDTDINLYEHQSNYNPNMPLRSLIYFVDIIKEHVINGRDLFSTHRIRIPMPHFAVFYNGIADRQEKEVLKLSASYEKQTETPELELVCTVYNLNPEKDEELLKKCKVLGGYTAFVEEVRKNEAKGIENPIEQAIEYCIRHHILERFFIERKGEVLNAMTIDMTFERREVLIRQEEREYGWKEGHAEGFASGQAEGHAEGFAIGQEGREEGRAEGRAEGRKEGAVERQISLVQKKIRKGKSLDEIADDLETTIEEIKPIYDAVLKYPDDTEPEQIYEELRSIN